MHRGIRVILLVVAAAVLPLSTALAQGKPKVADEGPEHYPAGPHREDTFYFCTACHSFKVVAQQGLSRERWDESFDWMVERHKMPRPEGADRQHMLDYLAAAFPEKAREPGGWKNPFAKD